MTHLMGISEAEVILLDYFSRVSCYIKICYYMILYKCKVCNMSLCEVLSQTKLVNILASYVGVQYNRI